MSAYKNKAYGSYVLQTLFAMVLLITALSTQADELKAASTKIVIQISSADKTTQNLVLNNAANAQQELGMDNVVIEVVGYGPGLKMITKNSPFRERVESLVSQNIRFSACANTMAAIERKTGKKPVLADGVIVVPAGVVRIVELEQEGYAYIRP